ncbi:MAG: HAD family hydrolase [Lachnospiraceae bacterium]|nr:HAD family hydrolase [Lachnospiraceae bacterium]
MKEFEMIKLIVTDMDGCLLDDKGALPPNFKEAYELMRKNNVIFTAASGRAIKGVQRPFGDYAKDMAFISDNGARAFYKGDFLFSRTLDFSAYMPVITELRKNKALFSVACGETRAWVEDTGIINKEMEEELSKYYSEWFQCDFEKIPERIVKLAILYFDDIENNIYPDFRKFDNDRICVQVTAYVWMDVYEKGISKGTAIKAMQDELGISPAETIVFGDYLNDISMAECASVSYAPANAHPDVKKVFTETIGSNTEYGVTEKIIEILRSE